MYKININKKTKLPLILLDNMVVMPNIVIPLFLEKPESLSALSNSLKKDRLIVFALNPKNKSKLHKVGTVARIIQMLKTPNNGAKIIAEGIFRAEIKTAKRTKENFLQAEILPVKDDKITIDKGIKALIQSILSQFRQCVILGKIVSVEALTRIFNTQDPNALINLIVFNLDLAQQDKQKLLEIIPIKKRLEKLNELLAIEVEILKAGKRLQKKTAKKLGKRQKEIFLREQLQNIEEELGLNGVESETAKFKKRIAKAKMPKIAKNTALKELSRLMHIPSFSPETAYIKNYLDWLIELPWPKKEKITKLNIKKAQKILNKDHYGLKEIKQRVLEYLATQKMVGHMTGSILCFIGPPGTGKTSIGKSIAKATNRKFYRMSVGGLHDEAEIRGHRRTYVGAMPGRILQGIKRVKTSNLIFMLDEIDKIGQDFRGDPAAALLEVLDPEQNNDFTDNYLELPFDLSGVMFITTGNVLNTIPPALRDRMEVIRFTGYTEKEKFHIAKSFLLPKQIKKHGLKSKNIEITDSALKKIVHGYTEEAGVRNLERQIAKICRKITLKIAKGSKTKHIISPKNLKQFLGPVKYDTEFANKTNEIGIAVGLAWTQVGGKITFIEATKMPGKGNLILTGNLGKVMKESAMAAFSYAKSVCANNKSWQSQDVHLHIPEGAIPKDGPSAGIAMATALVSLFENKPIRKDVAMSGEITLRGKVLEVGGVKEKILAAHRSGLKTVILPTKDKKYIKSKIPKPIQKQLKFIYADTMETVLKYALIKQKNGKK